MNEIQYRAISRDSYSSIKEFIDDRKKYYRKYVLGEDVKTKVSKAMVFGNLVDCLLLEPDEFDKRFAVAKCQAPPPQQKMLAEALFERTIQDLDEQGCQIHGLDYLLSLAYNDVKYDMDGNDVAFKRKGQTEEKVKLEFLKGPGKLWYEELRTSYGRTLVEPKEITAAENVVRELRTNEVTKGIINAINDRRYSIYNQEKILFEYKGNDMKCMVDKIVVDHEQKKIHVYDLKTTWDVEDNFMRNFFNEKYYIQAAVYDIAVGEWKKEKGIEMYEHIAMKFIVADSGNHASPLIYECDKDVIQKCIDGFEYNTRKYMGLNQALEEIEWHKNSGKWNVSMENLENRGIVKIKL